ncbi:rhomboid family intramembrane serine protease [Fulvivirgaceae bacterium BMA10]|uniref:Rhomboid family intramembrane serine protease n=1 Tax=Splendidivirga corallicola TaxID=3051826 RepID=A0ABT8KX19_9BACT|nr:rhomboid family intramembrane serine protease [Fulvivirgaceae bacterium BMA10]
MKTDALKFKDGVFFTASFIGLLWTIKAVEVALASDFGEFGILPGKLSGVIGIITGPLIHSDFTHLFSNTVPLLILGVGLIYFYNKIAFEVVLWIYLMTGFWVWLTAREAYHIGSSGIVYGLVAFLFFSGVFRRDAKSIAVSLTVAFLLGGMIYGIFPVNENISWESHLFGAISGIFCAFYFRKVKIFDNSITSDGSEDNDRFLEEVNRKDNAWSSDANTDYTFNYSYKPSEEAKDKKEDADEPTKAKYHIRYDP